METPKPLLKNLGAKLRQMMAEDWRGEDERNTLGMAGYWLEKLGEDETPKCSACELELLPELESGECMLCEEKRNTATSKTVASELRKDLLTALQWIDDGTDQEGRDLIVAPMMAKHSLHNSQDHG